VGSQILNVTQQPGYFLFKEGKAIKSATKGFTLIEMAMVLLIIGLLAKTAIAPFGALLAHNKREQAQSQLHQVKQAVFAYVVAYGALPCPMSRSAVREPAIIAGTTPLPLPEEQRPCLTSVGFVPAYASSGSDASASGWQAENLDDDNFFTYTDESIVPGEQFDDLLVWGSAADTLYWMLRMGWLP